MNRKALLVTTDRTLPKVILAILQPLGFDIDVCDSGGARSAYSGDYSMIVFDGIPRMELVIGCAMTVIINPEDPVKAYDAGADLVINRPIVANVFLAKIRSALRRYDIKI